MDKLSEVLKEFKEEYPNKTENDIKRMMMGYISSALKHAGYNDFDDNIEVLELLTK